MYIVRCRPGSEDWGGSGDWQPGAFEQAFRRGPAVAPARTEQYYGPANSRDPNTAAAAVPESEEGAVGREGSSDAPLPTRESQLDADNQNHDQPQSEQQPCESEQDESRAELQPPRRQRRQQQLEHYLNAGPENDHSGGRWRQQQGPQQQHQEQSRVPHYHLSFDDETSESDEDGSSSSGYEDDDNPDDDSHHRHNNDSTNNNSTTTTTTSNNHNDDDDDDDDGGDEDGSSYADSEELEDMEADPNAAGGRARGGFWPMLYCQ